LYITEGENDAVALSRIFEMYGKEEYTPAIVSLPRGASSARQALQKHAADIKRLFKEVVLCFDNDQPGQEAVQQAMLVLPDAKSVILPEKDANDCLINGKAKAAYNALAFNIQKPKNTRILSGVDLHDKAKQPAKYGELSWPFEKMNQDLRGIRLGETIYLAAGVKCGKSTVKSALIAHFIKNDKTKVFVAAPEEPVEQTYKLVAGQMVHKIFHDPEVPFDNEAFDKAGQLLKDNLYILNLYQQLSWNTLKEDIIKAVELGCKVVMVDPITSLTNGLNPADANTLLQSFAQDLAALAKDLNFVAILFAHLKAPEGQLSEDKRAGYYGKGQYLDLGNCSHEMGGSVYSNQIAGSRAMMRSAHLLLALLANKDPDLPEEIRNTRQLQVLEDRNLGVSAKYSIFYNKNTGTFIEA
jgi:5S rRNA maturation endonuclease (ribonuclease M5)